MKLRKWLIAILVFVMGIAMVIGVAACNSGKGETVTVTWYDGRSILKEEPVKKGATLTEWTPEKDGYVFMNWYSESSLSKKFDFDTVIDEDTNVYSKWRSSVVADDNRIWYTIGSISGSNWMFITQKNDDGVWAAVPGYEKFIFENKGDNTFEVTLTIRPNCKFRFVTNLLDETTWEGDEGRAEMGLGNLAGFEYAAGKNPEGMGKVDCTAADMEYGVVKDAQGNVIFHGGYEYNLPCNTWNIWPAEGSDGIYKFTVKTYPGYDDDNLIEWECLEKLDPLESQYDMYVVGTITGNHESWHDDYDEAVLLETDPNVPGLWRAYIDITEEMFPTWAAAENPKGVPAASIKIKNNVSGLDYGIADESGTTGENNIFLTAGTWCVTYDENTNAVSFAPCDTFVVGTIRFGMSNYNFVIGDGRITPVMTTDDDGATYKATIGVTDMREITGYTWLKNEVTEEGAPAIFAVKVAVGSSLGVIKFYGVDDRTSELFLGEEGTYEITYVVETGLISAEKIGDEVNIAKPVKVIYYNVTDTEVSRINTQELINGDKIEWTPAKVKGYRFDCWYLDEDCTEKYVDGADGVQSDLKLYGRYEEIVYVLDTTTFYITGSGQGDLKLAGNFTTITASRFTLEKSPELDEDGFTVYTSGEIKMYKGDQFKIVSDLSWTPGTHFGYNVLVNPGAIFCNEGGDGNIGLNRGNQGIYQFILHSDPFDYTNSYIEWVLIEPLPAVATEDMYIVGNLVASGNNSWSTNLTQMIHMTVAADGITWSVTIEMDPLDEFKIFNAINNGYHPGGSSANLKLKQFGFTEAGYYTVIFNADTDQVSIVAAQAPAEPEA